jgi:hypothetical protein
LFRLSQVGLEHPFVFWWHLGVTGVFAASLTTAVTLALIFHVIAIGNTGSPSTRRRPDSSAFQLPLIPGDLASFVLDRSNACSFAC